MPLRIGIVTFRADMHAIAVARAVDRLAPNIDVHIFEIDALSSCAGAHFLSTNAIRDSFLHDSRNRKVLLSTLNLVWWRRSTFPQRDISDLPADDIALVNRDSQAFIEALFTLNVTGGWVNYPWYAKRAENKSLQMLVALQEGMNVPETVITNDPSEVEKLLTAASSYVVKTLAGLPGKSLLTQQLTPELIDDEYSVRISPACYQKYITGDEHLRILVLGSECIGAMIPSSRIDSRIDLVTEPKRFIVPEDLQLKLQNILRRLKLAMGVFDLKIDNMGQPYFLEVNQQGQFLYLDAMADLGLVDKFAAFLLREATQPNYSLNPDES